MAKRFGIYDPDGNLVEGGFFHRSAAVETALREYDLDFSVRPQK